jgi:hypothetical protein
LVEDLVSVLFCRSTLPYPDWVLTLDCSTMASPGLMWFVLLLWPSWRSSSVEHSLRDAANSSERELYDWRPYELQGLSRAYCLGKLIGDHHCEMCMTDTRRTSALELGFWAPDLHHLCGHAAHYDIRDNTSDIRLVSTMVSKEARILEAWGDRLGRYSIDTRWGSWQGHFSREAVE